MKKKDKLKILTVIFLISIIIFTILMFIGYVIAYHGVLHTVGSIGSVISAIALGVTGIMLSQYC